MRRGSCAKTLKPTERSAAILRVADMFEPVDGLAVQHLLDRDMGHGGGRRGAVPVLFIGREPDHVAGPDLLHRSALALDQAAAGGHHQRLAKGMGVPGGAGAGLERDARACDPRRGGRGEQRVDPDRAGEPVGRPFVGGRRARAGDFGHAGVLTWVK